jgi:hypothetical protein
MGGRAVIRGRVCPRQPAYHHERVTLEERISNDSDFGHSAPWSVGQQGNGNFSHDCINLGRPRPAFLTLG